MPIYLDNAATTYPKPESVYQAMDRTSREVGVAPNRGGYRQSLDAARVLFEARESLASLFGADDSSRFIMTHSATESLNLAVRGLVRSGDHIVTTSMEHNSLARPLHAVESSGCTVTWVDGDSDGYISAEDILSALRDDTRLVAMTHCSNVTGALNPVQEIGPLLKERNILFLVDAAQSAGSVPIDVKDMKIDLLAVPGHKGLYGPQGTGFLYIAPGIELDPLILGGTGSASADLTPPAQLPERFESGTLNITGIAGLKAGVDFVISQGIEQIHRHEFFLLERLIKGLSSVERVILHNADINRPRGSVLSFAIEGMDPAKTGFLLDRDFDIAVRVGLHCAPLAHKTIGTFPQGTVRVSPGFFNTEKDIDTFLASVREIVEREIQGGVQHG
jgi:cysteine desulfurase / selenocysteine lyase